MLKHIAVRLRRSADAQIGFARRKAKIVASSLEIRDPALKNLTEGLYARGLSYRVDDCALYWYQIDDAKSAAFYQALNEVECAFDSGWFEQCKSSIRHLTGVRYYEACVDIAASFELKSQQRGINYCAVGAAAA